MNYLLDTNILSELRKPGGDAHVKAWFAGVPDTTLYISALVLGEIRQGIELLRRRDPVQAAGLEAWIVTVRSAYANRIVPITAEVAEEWGQLNVPDPLPPVDGLLAATARVHGWTLVTRNTAQVERTGVRLLNPFNPPPHG